MDIVPADYVVNGIVAAAWKTALSKRDGTLVCNLPIAPTKEG